VAPLPFRQPAVPVEGAMAAALLAMNKAAPSTVSW
jgi:hypothetical protein